MNETLHAEFVQELINTVLYKKQKELLEVIIRFVKVSFIADDRLKKLYNEVKHQYTIDKKIPTLGTLKMAFRKNTDILEVLEDVIASAILDTDVLLGQLERFIKNCRFIEIYNETVDVFNDGEKDKAYKLFEKGASEVVNFSIRKNAYETLFRQFSKRNAERLVGKQKQEIIPYFIDELQLHTGGGETGRFSLFLADAKMGKSFLLSHQSVHNARMGIPTLHWFLEGTKEENQQRMDACFMGSTLDEIKYAQIDEKKFKAHRKILENVGKGEVYMRFAEQFNAVTMMEIRDSVIDLRKQGINIKALGLDYLELAEPGDKKYGASEEKARQQATSRMCKNLATEQNLWLYSATQSQSIVSELSQDPDFVLKREHLSEDKGKVRPVDHLITLNQTKDEKKNKVMRLYIDAIRNREGDNIIYVATAFHRGRFYDRKRTINEFFHV
jgi:replicative DNA helicase